MSKPSCDACTRLREYNANFIMNGVTDNVASSLASNTGLNPCLTDLHTDCEDLNDVNDCLIGHMDDEVDNYEVCDWKDLLHNFFPNLYETLKAIIASICGLWTKIVDIEEKIKLITNYICNQLVAPQTTKIYGTYTGDQFEPNNMQLYCEVSSYETIACDGEDPQTVKNFNFVLRTQNDYAPQFNGGTMDSVFGYFTREQLVPAAMDDATFDAWVAKGGVVENGTVRQGVEVSTFYLGVKGQVGADTLKVGFHGLAGGVDTGYFDR